jgi:hypothetical protein
LSSLTITLQLIDTSIISRMIDVSITCGRRDHGDGEYPRGALDRDRC